MSIVDCFRMFLGRAIDARSASPLKRAPIMPWRDWCVTCHVSICAWCDDVATVITLRRARGPSHVARVHHRHLVTSLLFALWLWQSLLICPRNTDSPWQYPRLNSSLFSPLRPVGCGAGRSGRCLYPSESGWKLSSGAALIGIIRAEAEWPQWTVDPAAEQMQIKSPADPRHSPAPARHYLTRAAARDPCQPAAHCPGIFSYVFTWSLIGASCPAAL